MSNDMPVLSLLQQLKEGLVDPKSIDKDTRRQLVEVLYAESYTIYQVAQVFKCSEKTVQRDLKDIRHKNALTPSVDFAKEIIGEMVNRARQHSSSLARLGKAGNSTTQEKIVAKVSAWKIYKELVEKLQSLGYLPSRPTEIVSDVFHHSEKENTPEDLRKMISAIEESGKEAGIIDEEVKKKIKRLKKRIDQSEIALEIGHLKEKTNKKEEEKDE